MYRKKKGIETIKKEKQHNFVGNGKLNYSTPILHMFAVKTERNKTRKNANSKIKVKGNI